MLSIKLEIEYDKNLLTQKQLDILQANDACIIDNFLDCKVAIIETNINNAINILQQFNNND